MPSLRSIVPLLLVGPFGVRPWSGSTIVGRWDVVMQGPDARYPSWFEVTAAGGKFHGRWQGRGGHATPIAGIEQTGSQFRFTWPSEEDPKATAAQVTGTLSSDDALSGALVTPTGTSIAFSGVRAPALPARGTPKWGRPIDLLADGLKGWVPREPGKNGWSYAGLVLSNGLPSSDLISRPTFTDFKLHLEVNVPDQGNSGIYLRGRHEVQVLDSYGKEPHSRQLGGIYGQVTPTSLPAKRAGEWQTFDITLVGRLVTVVLNGVTIIDGQEIPGITGGALDSDEGKPGPIMLQGDHTAIRYRNVLITPREATP